MLTLTHMLSSQTERVMTGKQMTGGILTTKHSITTERKSKGQGIVYYMVNSIEDVS
jgi:hypothetical protein